MCYNCQVFCKIKTSSYAKTLSNQSLEDVFYLIILNYSTVTDFARFLGLSMSHSFK